MHDAKANSIIAHNKSQKHHKNPHKLQDIL